MSNRDVIIGNLGPALEINLLQDQMGGVGIYLGGCDLLFYTRVLLYSVKFGPSGAYNMEKFNRFVGVWESVMFSGTLTQTINTLNQFAPFLSIDEVYVYWGGFKIPPEPPISDFGPYFDPV